MDTTRTLSLLALALAACAPDVAGTSAAIGTSTSPPPLMLVDGGADGRASDTTTTPSHEGPAFTGRELAISGGHPTHRWIDPPRNIDGTILDPQPQTIPHTGLDAWQPPRIGEGPGTDFGGGAAGGGGEGDGSGGAPMPGGSGGDGSGGDGSGGDGSGGGDDGSGGAPLTGGGGGSGSGGGSGGGAGTGGGGGCATCGG